MERQEQGAKGSVNIIINYSVKGWKDKNRVQRVM
jgi:hypothetical protein